MLAFGGGGSIKVDVKLSYQPGIRPEMADGSDVAVIVNMVDDDIPPLASTSATPPAECTDEVADDDGMPPPPPSRISSQKKLKSHGWC